MSQEPTRSNTAKAATFGRARHRARQHASAHADDSAEAPLHSVSHPLVPTKAGELINTQAALDEFIAHLRAQPAFAYDSEFIGELTFHPQLCVLQAATTQRIGLIDPMAGLDLTDFWQLLCDPAITKIVHAGEQDIEPVHRLTGKPAANIFDTQVAAGFVGLAYPVGLSKLVAELLGAKLSKGLTFTHWDQRPLSNQQLRYAADDVRFLPALHAELAQRLEAYGHRAWADEEFATLCDPARYEFHPDTAFWRVRGAGGLTSPGLAVLRELAVWRYGAARFHNVPPRALIKDEILLDMARQPIGTLDRFARVKGLPRSVEAEHGQEIIDATSKALADPKHFPPAPAASEPTPSERFGNEAFYAMAAVLCAGQGIDPSLVLSRQDASDAYRAVLQKREPNSVIFTGWRRAVCGERLKELFECKRELHIGCADARLKLIE